MLVFRLKNVNEIQGNHGQLIDLYHVRVAQALSMETVKIFTLLNYVICIKKMTNKTVAVVESFQLKS